MIKPGTPPPYNSRFSTETGNTLSPSLPSDVKVHPTPNPIDPFHEPSPQQEVEWQTSLRNLEHQVISYQDRARRGGASEQDAENVAGAMDNVANSHADPVMKTQWKKKAKKFRRGNAKERDGILQGFVKGALILITSPFYLVGALFQMTGALLDGFGFAFRGAGKLSKKLAYTGTSSKRSKSVPNTQ